MKISISDKILSKYNLSIEEFMLLYLNCKDFDIKKLNLSLIKKGIAERDVIFPNKLVLSNNSKGILSSIIVESDDIIENSGDRFDKLAEELINIFPKGRKPGTTYYWRDSVTVISKRLKTLAIKPGVKFTDAEAIKATKDYVQSFNGNYKFMHLLKYFIWKNKSSSEGNEFSSELLSCIANEGQDNVNSEWTATVI